MTQSKITTDISPDVARLMIENGDRFVEVVQMRETGEFNISSHEGQFTYRGNDKEIAFKVVERILNEA